MPGVTSNEADSGIRVVVTPSQSSYFAGEPFSVTITFINTRSPDSSGSSAKNGHLGHKRGAHSISSAPLARPPTSPGPPRSALPAVVTRTRSGDEGNAVRKGLIGRAKKKEKIVQSEGGAADGLPALIEQRRKRLLAKSLSVSIAPHELEQHIGEGTLTRSAQKTVTETRPSPTSPHIPSPLSRSASLALSNNHPHARKQSVLDGQFNPTEVLTSSTSAPPTLPYATSAASSTVSLALDPISENSHSPYASTPMLISPSIETPITPFSPSEFPHPPSLPPNSVYAYPPHQSTAKNTQRPLGLGHPPTSINTNGLPDSKSLPHNPPRTAFSSSFPSQQSNAELILYSYAQLVGTLSLTPLPGASPTPDQTRTLNSVRASLLKKKVIGGGSMDITASLNSSASAGSNGTAPLGVAARRVGAPHRRTHSRSSSFSSGLLALLSGGSPAPTPGGSISMTPTSHSQIPSPSGSGGLPSSASWTAGQQRSRAASGMANGSASTGRIVDLGDDPPPAPAEEEIDPEVPLPTLEIQPSMLAVDLVLAPGESRSYTYSIPLPDNLPPTFRGRALKFHYELIVGTCRAGASPSTGANGAGGTIPPGSSVGGGGAMNSISKVMKVPIRVYNNVIVGRAPSSYDLLWPVSSRIGPRGHLSARIIEGPNPAVIAKRIGNVPSLPNGRGRVSTTANGTPSRANMGTFEDLQDYAQRLLDAFPEPGASGVRIKLPAEAVPLSPSRSSMNGIGGGGHHGEGGPNGIGNGGLNGVMKGGISPWDAYERERMEDDERRREREWEKEEEGGLTGCREAVEILTRNPKKASYDVNKDGVRVAILTFTKSAYRLGETVMGVIELNERISRARVIQYSVMLEAHETLPSSISPNVSRHLRRIHAEHYSSFALGTLRTTFSLDIPSDASPAFQIRVGGTKPLAGPNSPVVSFGGLEWKVRLCLLVAVGSDESELGTEGVRLRGMKRDRRGNGGGRGEWGSSWSALESVAPQERVVVPASPRDQNEGSLASYTKQSAKTSSWVDWAASWLAPSTENGYHDGDEDDEYTTAEREEKIYDGVKPDLGGGVGIGVNFEGGEDGWRDVRMETVECEVPIKVWPGNTAFKALDVVFDI
ncbi:hypothetical protein AX16_009379 [Volvariella volvacea WC 439]|nr:hypothetical protein AX16_009379 [Volvariella volvacea WC 439]